VLPAGPLTPTYYALLPVCGWREIVALAPAGCAIVSIAIVQLPRLASSRRRRMMMSEARGSVCPYEFMLRSRRGREQLSRSRACSFCALTEFCCYGVAWYT